MTNTDEYIGLKYRWIYESVDIKVRDCIASDYNISPILAEVLIKRGFIDKSDIDLFFSNSLKSLLNPFLLQDMDIAVMRIITSIKNGELICIYGDYDVDGISSTALLYLFLKDLYKNINLMYYIPNRLEEGYGLHKNAIEYLKSKNVKLIITVDCGISANDEVDFANKNEIDVIITDHHQTGDILPNAFAIINPMRKDSKYPFKSLAGVGVAFKLCMAIRHVLKKDSEWREKEFPNLKKFLDIVMLGTISDVVPLIGENRVMVTHGLMVMNYLGKERPGIDELKKVVGLNDAVLKSSQIGYTIAPRINAVGRLGDSDRGFKLLTTNNVSVARSLAYTLDRENKFRQNIERDILNEAISIIEDNQLHNKHMGLVLYGESWHPGVLGIIASRIVDKYNRPTIVLTKESGLIKGSARSIKGFHLYESLSEISHLLISYGGHKYAAGLKLEESNLSELKLFFDNIVKDRLKDYNSMPDIKVDSFIKPSDINNSFLDTLESFEPYGNCNKEPVFCMQNVFKISDKSISFVGKNSNHLKCSFLKDGVLIDAIGYNMNSFGDILLCNDFFDIIFTISRNYYNKDMICQFFLKDIRCST